MSANRMRPGRGLLRQRSLDTPNPPAKRAPLKKQLSEDHTRLNRTKMTQNHRMKEEDEADGVLWCGDRHNVGQNTDTTFRVVTCYSSHFPQDKEVSTRVLTTTRPRPVKVAWVERAGSAVRQSHLQDEIPNPVEPKDGNVELVARRLEIPRPRPQTRLHNLPAIGEKEAILYSRQQLAEKLRKAWREREKSRTNIDIFLHQSIDIASEDEPSYMSGLESLSCTARSNITNNNHNAEIESNTTANPVPKNESIPSAKTPTVSTGRYFSLNKIDRVTSTEMLSSISSRLKEDSSVSCKKSISNDTTPNNIKKKESWTQSSSTGISGQTESKETTKTAPDTETVNTTMTNVKIPEHVMSQISPESTSSLNVTVPGASRISVVQTGSISTEDVAAESPSIAERSMKKVTREDNNIKYDSQDDNPRKQQNVDVTVAVSKLSELQENESLNFNCAVKSVNENRKEPSQVDDVPKVSKGAPIITTNTEVTTKADTTNSNNAQSVKSHSNSAHERRVLFKNSVNNSISTIPKPPDYKTRAKSAFVTNRSISLPHTDSNYKNLLSSVNKKTAALLAGYPKKNSNGAIDQKSTEQNGKNADLPNRPLKITQGRERTLKSAPIRLRRPKTARRKSEDLGDSSDGEENRGKKPSKSSRGRRGLRSGAEIVTMVSLISPAVSDTENEVMPFDIEKSLEWEQKKTVETKKEEEEEKDMKPEWYPTRIFIKKPKAVSFQADRPRTTAIAPRPKEEPRRRAPPPVPTPASVERRTSNYDPRVRKRLIRARTAPQHERERNEDEAQNETPPTDVSATVPSSDDTTFAQDGLAVFPIETTSEGNGDVAGTTANGDEDEGNKDDEPQFTSPKEKECWHLYQKMCEKGLTVSYDTVLRGMLTPTEYRLIRQSSMFPGC